MYSFTVLLSNVSFIFYKNWHIKIRYNFCSKILNTIFVRYIRLSRKKMYRNAMILIHKQNSKRFILENLFFIIKMKKCSFSASSLISTKNFFLEKLDILQNRIFSTFMSSPFQRSICHFLLFFQKRKEICLRFYTVCEKISFSLFLSHICCVKWFRG